jgi:hypothetical protein
MRSTRSVDFACTIVAAGRSTLVFIRRFPVAWKMLGSIRNTDTTRRYLVHSQSQDAVRHVEGSSDGTMSSAVPVGKSSFSAPTPYVLDHSSSVSQCLLREVVGMRPYTLKVAFFAGIGLGYPRSS